MIGSISHGTLNELDLVPAFLSALRELAPERAAQIEGEYEGLILALPEVVKGTDPIGSDALGWLMETLDDALNEAAPERYRLVLTRGTALISDFWLVDE